AELGFTSDGFFELENRPQRVAIVGSGYVSVELAGVFNALGSDTTVLVRKDSVLRSFDRMLGEELRIAMEAAGIHFKPGLGPRSREKPDPGLELTTADGRRAGPLDGVLGPAGRG